MSDRKRVLVAAAGKRNLELLQQFLGKEGFETVAASSLADIRLALEQIPSACLQKSAVLRSGRSPYRPQAKEATESLHYVCNGLTQASTSIDIAVFDVSGFSSEVWALCDKLRERSVPFVVISSAPSADIESRAAHSGARVVMTKPLVVRNLIRVLHAMLSESH